MFYTVYKITNKVNGKIYIGIHKTHDLEDGYMGSGNLIKRAIKKHGLTNFDKEYLHIFDNPIEMYETEEILVHENYIKKESNYNIKTGGSGGFSHIKTHGMLGKKHSIKSKQKMSNAKQNLPDSFGKAISERMIGNENNLSIRKPISVAGVLYSNINIAAKSLDLKYSTLYNRVKSKNYPDYLVV